eukprot:m.444268 g.444268  ORF g.444268 m.444268 type:complete len:50 (+) comp19077_c0_seq1:2299-2448(+)
MGSCDFEWAAFDSWPWFWHHPTRSAKRFTLTLEKLANQTAPMIKNRRAI